MGPLCTDTAGDKGKNRTEPVSVFLLFIAVLTLFSILLNAGMGIPTGNALLSSAFLPLPAYC